MSTGNNNFGPYRIDIGWALAGHTLAILPLMPNLVHIRTGASARMGEI